MIKNKRIEKPPFALAFFLLAFGSVLFLICIFRVLSFTVALMPVLLFFLVFCIPIGRIITLKCFAKSQINLLRSNLFLQIALLFSLLGFTVCLKIADPLSTFIAKDHFPFLSLGLLWISELLLFSPFFIAWSASEYSAYKLAKGKLKKRKYFYGISILGAFAAYCFANFTFPYIGLIKTILLSFLSLLFIQFLVNTTALAKRYLFGMACIVVLYFLSTGSSNFEDKFVVFIQGNGALSTKSILNKEFAMKPLNTKFGERDNTFDVTEILFQKWTKYCHLGLIKSGRYLYGLYNGRLNWAYTSYLTSPPSIQESLDILPFLLLPKNSSIIIIGAGGGMQVKYALFFDPKEVIALEPISEIIYALQNECPESNENIFLRKNVKCVTMEANRYLETVGQDYDLIYIINTGGKFGMFRRFIAPSHFSYSVQSFKQIKNKLKPGGVIAIAIEGSRHKRSGFLKQYFANLQKAGFIARGYLRERTELGKRSYLLVGYKDYIPNPSLSEEFEKRLLADNDLIIKVAEEFEINVKSH